MCNVLTDDIQDHSVVVEVHVKEEDDWEEVEVVVVVLQIMVHRYVVLD